MKIGQKVVLLKDVTYRGGVLKEGSVHPVTDVGTRYGLPFITPEGFSQERQLQFGDYEIIHEFNLKEETK